MSIWEQIESFFEDGERHHHRHHHHVYRVSVRQKFHKGEHRMANGIITGSSGTFRAELLDNGQPVALPSGSTWTWVTDNSNATVTPDASDPTGATVVVAIPAKDAGETITVTASTTDPKGATQSFPLTVPVTAPPEIFSVSVTQIA